MPEINHMKEGYNKAVGKPAPTKLHAVPATPRAALTSAAGATNWGLTALTEETHLVATAVEGTRNHALNRSAFKLAQIVAAGNLPAQLVLDELTNAARTAGLGDAEITQTLNSALPAGAASPRTATEKETDTEWLDGLPLSTDTRTDMETMPDTPVRQFINGGLFIFDIPDKIPAVWGNGAEVLWAEGEALMIVGPSGVGKTTLTGQIVRALLGLQPAVLGYTVNPQPGNILYLAMDRPRQIARSLRRHFQSADRPTVEQHLKIWPGPPPADMAANPEILATLCQQAGASVVIVDSLKDAAVGLSEDATGAGYNRARQHAIRAGVQVLELHHQTKRNANGGAPKALADVYGSTWITGGAGSVILLWGEAGDSIIELHHLKQPAETVGPFKIMHDHDGGTSSIWSSADPLELINNTPNGVMVHTLAAALFETDRPSRNQIETARRKLDKLAASGLCTTREIPAATGGKPTIVYDRVKQAESNHEAITNPLFGKPPTDHKTNHENP